MRTRSARLAMNRGLVSRLGLARADIKRLQLAAETMTNWVPRVLGSMMLRPGWGYLGNTLNNKRAFYIPFVFSLTDKAKLEITEDGMRVWINDEVVQRESVSTAVTNGSFTSNVNGWTDNDQAGADSAWETGGYMYLQGSGSAFAIRAQEVTVAAGDQGKRHALRIVVERGPVILRVGSTDGGDDYITQVTLATGTHSLAFTPSGNFWIQFKSQLARKVLIASCEVEAAGDMVVPTPWAEADLDLIRFDQSADVIFVACGKTSDTIGYQQRRIERRAADSWSVVLYQPEDGPFRVENVSEVTLTASALEGNITLTASAPMFRTGHVGALFQITSIGQQVVESITAENVFSDPIRITGVDSGRIFTITITGLTGTGSEVTLQRSLDEPGNWEDVSTGGSPASPWTANATRTYNDNLDNQIVYYRIGVKTGDYVGGPIVCTLSIGSGSITGVARITGYTSTTVVNAEVLKALGSLAATDVWAEGEWSNYRGWPTAVAFHEGRLCWAGRDKTQISISDAFDSFDPDFEGDAGPIQRSIGSGPVDSINWLLSLQRLIVGAQMTEFSGRSSSLDEPITPSNFNLKPASTQGSNAAQAVKVDQNGIFVQRGGVRVFSLEFGSDGIDYDSTQLSALIPEIGEPGIRKILVQRQPDTRVHFIRLDGTVAMLVFDKVEQVICWLEIETDGEIEDGCILPGDVGDGEDHVYYSVKREIGGQDKRFLEKWAFESECRGGQVCKLADAHVTYNQSASSTITGLTHLIGKEVVVWDNGKCLRDADGEIATFEVDGSGEIAVTNAGEAYEATVGMVGLPYEAPWRSAKLVELMEQPGGSLLDHQRLVELGIMAADIHAQGLKYGTDFTEMDDMPVMDDNGGPVDPDAVRTDYAEQPFTPPGGWTVDSRICLLAKAPRPVTVLGVIAKVEHHG